MTDYVYMIMNPREANVQDPEQDNLLEYIGAMDEQEAHEGLEKWKHIKQAYIARWEFPLEPDGPFHSAIVINNKTKEEHGN